MDFYLQTYLTSPGAICLYLSYGVVLLLFTLIGMSKWNAIAHKFPVRAAYTGAWQSLPYLKIVGICSFRNCVSMAANSDFLFLSAPVFLPFLAAMQIPWSALSRVEDDGSVLRLYGNDWLICISSGAISDDLLAQLSLQLERAGLRQTLELESA